MSKSSKSKSAQVVKGGLGVTGIAMTTPASKPRAKAPKAKKARQT